MKDNPNRFKYGRVFRSKLKNFEKSDIFLNAYFYVYGLKAVENGKIKKQHIQSMFRLLRKLYKKTINFRFNVSLVVPVTDKPREARMGKGKAKRDHWECPVKKGTIILELSSFNFWKIRKGLVLLKEKLPLETKIIKVTY